MLYAVLAALVLGVVLHASPLVPWLKVHVLGYEKSGAERGIHVVWAMVATMAALVVVSYAQGHRGTRLFPLKVVGATAAVVGYLWLMATTGTTTEKGGTTTR